MNNIPRKVLVGESLGALSEHEHERGKPGGVNREVTSYKSSPGGYRVNTVVYKSMIATATSMKYSMIEMPYPVPRVHGEN